MDGNCLVKAGEGGGSGDDRGCYACDVRCVLSFTEKNRAGEEVVWRSVDVVRPE